MQMPSRKLNDQAPQGPCPPQSSPSGSRRGDIWSRLGPLKPEPSSATVVKVDKHPYSDAELVVEGSALQADPTLGFTELGKNFNIYLKQVDSAQDFVTFGKNARLKWIVLADGHGKSSVINCIRAIKWEDIIEADNINGIVYSAIRALGNTAGDGSTLTIVKIYPTYIDCYWAGDSEARVFRNKVEVFRTLNHDAQNSLEMERFEGLSTKVSSERCAYLHAVNALTVTQSFQTSRYFAFSSLFTDPKSGAILPEKCKINMTHSFGHNGMSGNFMSYSRIPLCKEGDGSDTVYKVIVGSDGFWDMICNSDHDLIAEKYINSFDLGNIAISRWNKTWEYFLVKDRYDNLIEIRNRIHVGKGDDVSVGVWVGKI